MAPQGKQSDTASPADWFPDWVPQPDATPARATNNHLHAGRSTPNSNSIRLSNVSHGHSSTGDKFQTSEDPEAAEEEDPSALTPARYDVETTQDKAVKYVSLTRLLCRLTDVSIVDVLAESIFLSVHVQTSCERVMRLTRHR